MRAGTAVLPGAEPFRADGAGVGALLCHGFTGSPQSLRPWAEHLAAAGLTVRLPRLPGHGTSVQEMSRTRWEDWYAAVERELDDLRRKCDSTFVMGLSMGGTLALRLAEQHPRTVSGLVLVNPSLYTDHPAMKALPLLRFVIPVLKGPLNDIRKQGVPETGYDRMPLHALHSLTTLWEVTGRDLARIEAPILLYRSTEDHVVPPISAQHLRQGVRTSVDERLLHNSYHVATLDHDAEEIFRGSVDFVREHSGARSAVGAGS